MTDARANQPEGDNQDLPHQHGCGHPPYQHGPKTIEKFRKQKAPTFDGLSAPPEAEAWVRSLERIFSFMECSDAEKIKCATHQFEREADYWWESTTRMMTPEELAELTWEGFKEKFYEMYIPQTYRHIKEAEFWSLQQSTKTVSEYDRAFTQLARYAPQMVDTEAKRVSKFTRGLRPEIGMPLAGQGDLTYAQALGRALSIEGMIPKKDDNGYPSRTYSQAPLGWIPQPKERAAPTISARRT